MQNKNVLHNISGGLDLFWTLRGALGSGRDIQCAPKNGIFQPTSEPRNYDDVEADRDAEVESGNRMHMRYGIGGQLMQIYRQTVGREFQAHA